MIELEQARAIVLEQADSLGGEDVPLQQTLGRVLARDVVSAVAVPAFDNSAMDGYAVRACDVSAGERPALRVIGESRAGHPFGGEVQAGQAVAISTGAPIPAGADAVVRVEDTEHAEAGEETVLVLSGVERGNDVRRAGDDIRAGETVMRRGARVDPVALGVLASVLDGEVCCSVRPRVRMLFTGDELTAPGEPRREGSVRNTNALALPAAARELGAEVEGVARVGDERAATREAIASMLGCDVAVICGGMSVGEHDHVRPALAELGAEQLFAGIALRPGRPAWFGQIRPRGRARPVLLFGLPGNPVSALVTFVLLVRPCLRALAGADPASGHVRAILDSGYAKQPGRTHAVRCSLRIDSDGWHAEPTGAQGSHVLTSLLGADGLAMIPAPSSGVGAGETVDVELLPAFPERLG